MQGSLPAHAAARSSTARRRACYPPGSSIKPVIAALALESGRYTPTAQFTDPGYFAEYGQQITNDNGERSSARSISPTRSRTRSTASSRSSAASSAAGARAARRCTTRPRSASASTRSRRSTTRPTSSRPRARSARARQAALAERADRPRPHGDRPGQPASSRRCRWRWSPARSRNGGVVMRPTLVDRVRSPERARSRYERHSEPLNRAFSEQTARRGDGDDEARRRRGHGHARPQIPGVQIAGKTGTAQTGRQRPAGRVVHRVRARARTRRSRSRWSSSARSSTAARPPRRSPATSCRRCSMPRRRAQIAALRSGAGRAAGRGRMTR